MNLKGRKDRQKPDPKQVEKVANELSDKEYGAKGGSKKESVPLARTTISLPEELLNQVEDLALANKRSGKTPKSVSGVAVDALRLYLLQSKSK